MKLARLQQEADPYWAIVEEESALPLEGGIAQWGTAAMAGEIPAEYLRPARRHTLHDARLLAPLEATAKIICFGLNYRSHLDAFGKTMPDRQLAYLKAPTAVIAHENPLRRPRITHKLDYEIELVGVVARDAQGDDDIENLILGYTIGNDVSARDLVDGPRGVDLYSVKSLNGTCAIGPWIITSDEIPSPPDLAMQLRVNGETRQSARTSSMEWKIDALLAYANERTRLLAGDLIFTGTPAGVGLEDGRFLEPGDAIEAEIESIGVLRNRVEDPT